MKQNKRLNRVFSSLFLALPLCAVFALTALAADGTAEYLPAVYATFWALIPSVVAIALALITKEVYSSLFFGILVGALLYSGGGFELTITHIFEDGIIAPISSWAAAVTGFVESEDGFAIFIRAIPYNYYAILTLVMMISMVILRVEYPGNREYGEGGELTAINGFISFTIKISLCAPAQQIPGISFSEIPGILYPASFL